MTTAVRSDKDILGGTPCFSGTRVPVKSLFDHLEGGYTVDYFLEQFPTVKRDQVLSVLEAARVGMEQEAVAAPRS